MKDKFVRKFMRLAKHIGEGYSQLGNDEARKLAGRPLDRAHWGI